MNLNIFKMIQSSISHFLSSDVKLHVQSKFSYLMDFYVSIDYVLQGILMTTYLEYVEQWLSILDWSWLFHGKTNQMYVCSWASYLLTFCLFLSLQNYGAFLEKDGAGFQGQVKLTGFEYGVLDITKFEWTYQVSDHTLVIYSAYVATC